MARSLTVENETHWRTKDVRRLVRAAMDAAGSVPTIPRSLKIVYASNGRAYVQYNGSARHILIDLPKRGTAKPHPNALVALAGAGVDSATPLMPFQDVYRLGHNLAFWFAKEDGTGQEKSLSPFFDTINPPSWDSSLFIAKYADPAKDAKFVEFCKRTEKRIAAAQDRVDKWTAEEERAAKNRKRAERDLKDARKSLRDAKRRRGL